LTGKAKLDIFVTLLPLLWWCLIYAFFIAFAFDGEAHHTFE